MIVAGTSATSSAIREVLSGANAISGDVMVRPVCVHDVRVSCRSCVLRQAGLVLRFEARDGISLDVVGHDGRLPNLDLINTAVRVLHMWPTMEGVDVAAAAEACVRADC